MKKFIGFRIAVFTAAVLVFGCLLAVYSFEKDKISLVSKNSLNTDCVRVFVSGAVENPGVVTAEPGVSLYDAASECVFCENAYIDEFLKLETTTDGDEVYIMTDEEYKALQSSPKININTADVAGLDTLPGIGTSLAQRIIDFRSQNGNFRAVQELMLVPGIGEAKYNELKLFITVSQED